jgi:hypothetical protein
MISRWKELSGGMKVFYIAGLVSLIGLGVMVLTGMTGIGDILAWKWDSSLRSHSFCSLRVGRCSKLNRDSKNSFEYIIFSPYLSSLKNPEKVE